MQPWNANPTAWMMTLFTCIKCAPGPWAFVTTPPLKLYAATGSVAVITCPPPSTVTPLGTVRGEVTSPQLSVNVNVVPVIVPVHTASNVPSRTWERR